MKYWCIIKRLQITGGSGRILRRTFHTDKKSTTASFKGTTTQFDSMDGIIDSRQKRFS